MDRGDRRRAGAHRAAVRRRVRLPRCWPSPTSSISSRRTRSATPGPSPSCPPRPGRELGLDAGEVRALRRAGLVHGFGRLGVSNAHLGQGRVRWPPASGSGCACSRTSPGRMLQQSEALAPLGALAVQHRERLDGSGYPRGLVRRRRISRPARVLGAVDAYQSMREPRPYRPARSADEAAAELQAEVKAGRLDGDAVDRGARRGRPPRRPAPRRARPGSPPARSTCCACWPAGLSSKEIAARLVISPKTARNHIEHIYTKTGATSRVTASLFAMQHGLLPDDLELTSLDRWGNCPMTFPPAVSYVANVSRATHPEADHGTADRGSSRSATTARWPRSERAGLAGPPRRRCSPAWPATCSRSGPGPASTSRSTARRSPRSR